jgi:hypothetical protein
MPWWAVLFWIWVAVSVVVLLRRWVARRATRRVAEAAEVDVDHADAAPAPAPAPAPEPVPVLAATPAPAPIVERHIGRTAPAAGIADALVGIKMPCDLVPLVFDRLATDKLTLSTVGFPADAVGVALADEVERLGYVVRPLSDREVIATRGATELRLTILRPGPDGRHPHHPQARDDSIVVEIVLS